jgi:hypothetical protein
MDSSTGITVVDTLRFSRVTVPPCTTAPAASSADYLDELLDGVGKADR